MSVRQNKGRVAEIPNFCILATEPFPTLDLYYKEDEIILFHSPQEAVEKINFYLSDLAEYEALFTRGRRALWARNTVYHEWNKILAFIDPDFVPMDVREVLQEHHAEWLPPEYV